MKKRLFLILILSLVLLTACSVSQGESSTPDISQTESETEKNSLNSEKTTSPIPSVSDPDETESAFQELDPPTSSQERPDTIEEPGEAVPPKLPLQASEETSVPTVPVSEPAEVPSGVPAVVPPETPAETNPLETQPPVTEPEKTIYDMPFDVEAIRSELMILGESMGLTHVTSDDGVPCTPESCSWASPITASSSMQGENLKRALHDYVSSMPGIIAAYGGASLDHFTIYVRDNGNGSYTFYFLY